MLNLLKQAGAVTGILKDSATEAATGHRSVRLAATALVVALLVWAGVDADVAAAVGSLLESLTAE